MIASFIVVDAPDTAPLYVDLCVNCAILEEAVIECNEELFVLDTICNLECLDELVDGDEFALTCACCGATEVE